jgi:hypothetical protein
MNSCIMIINLGSFFLLKTQLISKLLDNWIRIIVSEDCWELKSHNNHGNLDETGSAAAIAATIYVDSRRNDDDFQFKYLLILNVSID